MQRYFVDGDKNNIKFTDNDIFHITKVMRFRINDQIEIVVNENLYIAKITNLQPLEIEIIEQLMINTELPVDITLLYCLPKGDKLDLVVQKCTELGVSEIIGVRSKFTIVKIEPSEVEKKLNRFNKIIKEAAEQSRRNRLMKFSRIIDFKLISEVDADIKLIAYEKYASDGASLYDQLCDIKSGNKIAIIVGAEGGFDENEVDFATKCGFVPVGLGKRILRSETAAINVVSNIAFMAERKKI